MVTARKPRRLISVPDEDPATLYTRIPTPHHAKDMRAAFEQLRLFDDGDGA